MRFCSGCEGTGGILWSNWRGGNENLLAEQPWPPASQPSGWGAQPRHLGTDDLGPITLTPSSLPETVVPKERCSMEHALPACPTEYPGLVLPHSASRQVAWGSCQNKDSALVA